MSVSSILAFVLLGTRAFIGPRDRAEEKPTRPSYAELKARVAELEADIGAANELARRDQELIDMWRERALANVPAVIAAPQQNWQLAQQQGALLQQQLYSQAQQYMQQGLLGAQTLNNSELWCNCVPARHDMFLRGE